MTPIETGAWELLRRHASLFDFLYIFSLSRVACLTANACTILTGAARPDGNVSSFSLTYSTLELRSRRVTRTAIYRTLSLLPLTVLILSTALSGNHRVYDEVSTTVDTPVPWRSPDLLSRPPQLGDRSSRASHSMESIGQ